jgi:protein-S-isoprenylcysteine O-methyltransferase Ste14
MNMDSIRYGLAVVLVCGIPPVLLFWPLVHGFIHIWRLAGPVITYGSVLGVVAVGVLGLFQVRDFLIGRDFATQWPLVIIGVICLVVAAWLRVMLAREISNAQLAGLPELQPERHQQRLIRTGPYAWVRHPRYMQFWIALIGYALTANYLGTYLVALLWLPGISITVYFEECELHERFGRDYGDYCNEVPRFFPRLRGRKKTRNHG